MKIWNNQNADTTGTYWDDILNNCEKGDIVIDAVAQEYTVTDVWRNKKFDGDITIDSLFLHLNKKDGTPNKQFKPVHWSRTSDRVLWRSEKGWR